ncbi:MAG: hypothetical protein HY096_05315 [Nitrospinae bacterium]|nr:hypothetical protein [Nitrospinota bacterium]
MPTIDIYKNLIYLYPVNKRHDLLAKYFATLSQIIFGAVVIKQVTVSFNLLELIIGFCGTVFFIILAYFIQPKE